MTDQKSDHDLLVEMHMILIGSENAPGLVRQVQKYQKDCDQSTTDLRKCLNALKIRFSLLIGFLDRS